MFVGYFCYIISECQCCLLHDFCIILPWLHLFHYMTLLHDLATITTQKQNVSSQEGSRERERAGGTGWWGDREAGRTGVVTPTAHNFVAIISTSGICVLMAALDMLVRARTCLWRLPSPPLAFWHNGGWTWAVLTHTDFVSIHSSLWFAWLSPPCRSQELQAVVFVYLWQWHASCSFTFD